MYSTRDRKKKKKKKKKKKMIKQQKQILQLELEKRKLLEENQRLREVCGILGKEKRENEIRQNSRY